MDSPLFDPERLVEFTQELHLHGFVFSVEQYTAAQDLLITLVAEGRAPADQQNFSTWLAPIFCASPEEQRIFHDVFKQWLERQSQNIPETVEAEVRAETDGQPAIKNVDGDLNPTPRPFFWFPILLIFLGSLILTAFLRPSRSVNGVVVDEYKTPVGGAK